MDRFDVPYIQINCLTVAKFMMDRIAAAYSKIESLVATHLVMDRVTVAHSKIESLVATHLVMDRVTAAHSKIESLVATHFVTDRVVAAVLLIYPSSAMHLSMNLGVAELMMDLATADFLKFDSLAAAQLAMHHISASASKINSLTEARLVIDHVVADDLNLDHLATTQTAMNSVTTANFKIDLLSAAQLGMDDVAAAELKIDSLIVAERWMDHVLAVSVRINGSMAIARELDFIDEAQPYVGNTATTVCIHRLNIQQEYVQCLLPLRTPRFIRKGLSLIWPRDEAAAQGPGSMRTRCARSRNIYLDYCKATADLYSDCLDTGHLVMDRDVAVVYSDRDISLTLKSEKGTMLELFVIRSTDFRSVSTAALIFVSFAMQILVPWSIVTISLILASGLAIVSVLSMLSDSRSSIEGACNISRSVLSLLSDPRSSIEFTCNISRSDRFVAAHVIPKLGTEMICDAVGETNNDGSFLPCQYRLASGSGSVAGKKIAPRLLLTNKLTKQRAQSWAGLTKIAMLIILSLCVQPGPAQSDGAVTGLEFLTFVGGFRSRGSCKSVAAAGEESGEGSLYVTQLTIGEDDMIAEGSGVGVCTICPVGFCCNGKFTVATDHEGSISLGAAATTGHGCLSGLASHYTDSEGIAYPNLQPNAQPSLPSRQPSRSTGRLSRQPSNKQNDVSGNSQTHDGQHDYGWDWGKLINFVSSLTRMASLVLLTTSSCFLCRCFSFACNFSKIVEHNSSFLSRPIWPWHAINLLWPGLLFIVVVSLPSVTCQGVTTVAGSGSAAFADGVGTSASFEFPDAVALDTLGNLYVADNMNHRIRVISSTGAVTTLAGSGSPAFADGFGTAASFKFLDGAALDTLGNVYVADRNNNRIRKNSPAGTVTTLAGPGSAAFADGVGIAASFNQPAGVAIDY